MRQLSRFLPLFLAVALLFAGCDSSTTPEMDQVQTHSPANAAGPAAAPNTVFDLDFSDASDAQDVTVSTPGWQVDRNAPDTWETATLHGEDVLHINMDKTDPTSGFYTYQGKKYLPQKDGHWQTGYGTVLSYSFYIDPSWENDGTGQETGMWGVLADDSDDIVAYPILEYQDSDASDTDEARFRVYTYEGGGPGWTDLGTPQSVDPEEGGWVDVEMRFLRHGKKGKGNGKKLKGGKINWHVNGSLVFEDNGIPQYGNPTQFLEPILNSGNFGTDQDYYYDDITLTAPGHPGGN